MLLRFNPAFRQPSCFQLGSSFVRCLLTKRTTTTTTTTRRTRNSESLTMTVSCDCCGRTSSDLNHFSQHIWAKNPQSQRCFHYFSRKEERAANLEQPAQKKRRLMRQRREAIIGGSEELLENLKSNETSAGSDDGAKRLREKDLR